VLAQQLQPESTYLQLFITTSDNPPQETTINARITALEQPYSLVLQFEYKFTIEGLSARAIFDYSQTRYLNDTQELKFIMKGSNAPLTFTSNLDTYKTISIVICITTVFSLVCLMFGLISPKFIGVEMLMTLQLIFYSQILIINTEKWPAGFLYLKYLKFTSGYNNLFNLTSYSQFGADSIKHWHLAMKKTFIENFNLNFVILFLITIVFLIFFIINTFKQTKLLETKKERQKVKKT
jgi:hypothetical protein